MTAARQFIVTSSALSRPAKSSTFVCIAQCQETSLDVGLAVPNEDTSGHSFSEDFAWERAVRQKDFDLMLRSRDR